MTPSEIGTSMLSVPRAHRAQRAAEERLAGIGRRRQRDQRRQPVEEIARLRRHVGDVAGPHRHRQQHDVHGGEAGDREALQQPFGLRGSRRLRRVRLERMGAIADRVERLDDLGRLDFASRQSTARRRLVKLSRASMTPGNCFKPPSILRMQPAQPTPSTARVICDAPASPRSTKVERSSVSAMVLSLHFKTMRFLERNSRSPSRDSSMTRSHWPAAASVAADEVAGRALAHRRRCGRGAGRSDARARAGVEAGQAACPRASRAVMSSSVVPSAARVTLASTCQCCASCALRHGDVALER